MIMHRVLGDALAVSQWSRLLDNAFSITSFALEDL